MKQLKDSNNKPGIRIVFLGPPGSGKGTQSKFIAKKFHIPHISVGDIIRKEIVEGSEFALNLKSIQDNGKMIPDDVVLAIIEKQLMKKECAKGFILDGFPRTLFQVTQLETLLKKLNQELTHVFYMVTSLNVITKRLLGRMTCPSCGNVFNLHYKVPQQEGICDLCKSSLISRKDDSEQFIADRFSLYEQLTTPLIKYYEEMGLLKKVDAGGSSEEVMNTIIKNCRYFPKAIA